MSWSSRKKKQDVFCTVYFVQRNFFNICIYLNVQRIEQTFRIYIVLHIKKHYFNTPFCLFLKLSKAFSVSLEYFFREVLSYAKLCLDCTPFVETFFMVQISTFFMQTSLEQNHQCAKGENFLVLAVRIQKNTDLQNFSYIFHKSDKEKYMVKRGLQKITFCLVRNHCVKSVRIRSYSDPHFTAFRLNTETEYGEKRSISPYSVRMRENTDQNNSEYGHF